jgi:ribosomal protein S18 acetylase RimI-like enzyme
LGHLRTASLSAADIDQIFALYTLARSKAAYGFLADRDKDDFHEIFQRPDDVISTGIWDNDRLIAYFISKRIMVNPYPCNPIFSMIDPKASNIYRGQGTVVHPEYHGRTLGKQLLRSRTSQIAERGIDHYTGLVAVDNLVAIKNLVASSGHLLVGFARDQTSLNYITYFGCLRGRLSTAALPCGVSWQDIERQQRLFAQCNVVCDFKPAGHTERTAGRPVGEWQLTYLPLE